MDKISTTGGYVPALLGIDPAQQTPHNNLQKLPRYECEPLLGEAIHQGYGLGIRLPVHCPAPRLASPNLDEIQEMPNQDQAVLIATLKCVAHAEAVEGSQQVAPAWMLDWSTVVSMEAARRPLL